MPLPRDALTPDTLALIQSIAHHGSFAAAARHLGLVPSALTYRVRQVEEALDVLLFDRRTRQAQLTEAGAELLRESERLLADVDALANRIQRVATGWEPQFTIAVDGALDPRPIYDLCEAFYALSPPTRLRLREEYLSGTRFALSSGRADLAIGMVREPGPPAQLRCHTLGTLPMVFAVAPHHPLAAVAEPLPKTLLRQYRAVAVADSLLQGNGLTLGLQDGQPVLTVPHMNAKLQAQLQGLGCGHLPQHLAAPHVANGTLVVKKLAESGPLPELRYGWLESRAHGKAMAWWQQKLTHAHTRQALLGIRLDGNAPTPPMATLGSNAALDATDAPRPAMTHPRPAAKRPRPMPRTARPAAATSPTEFTAHPGAPR